ncbi:MAG TPA: uroporphyrinogen decarboxylase family protein, partial [Spirochaetia bacterium]|nr:uroporphyrinogen decarboxylase family protein [Spirochaetia bacterium]
VSALTTVELQHLTGCTMPGVHHDPEKLVSLCGANHDVLGFDAVTFIINYFNEPAALGCKLDWGSERALPVYTSHPWSGPEDAAVPGDLLDRKPVSTCIESIRLARKKYGSRIAVLGKVMGPFSMTQVMHGIEKVMVGVLEKPEAIKQLLEVSLEVLVRCANAQLEAGADAVAIGEGGAGANMMSPEMYETILLDVHRRMIGAIHGPTVMHICGDITPRLELLARTGLTCFNFDWEIRPRTMKRVSAGKFRIMGNINTTDLLRGTPEMIRKQVIENIEAGVDVISPGCAVSPECPNANLKALSDTVCEHFK